MLGLAPGDVRRVTVMFIGRVGDLIVSTPLLRSIRRRFPNARVKLVISTLGVETAALIPFIDETAVVYKLRRPWATLRLAGSLAASPSDLFIDINPSFSRLSTTLSALVRSRVKLAFEKRRLDGLFTHVIENSSKTEHVLDRCGRVAAWLEAPYEPRLELRVPDAEPLLPVEPGRFNILVHPGNFKKFDNRWPERNFVELADRLQEHPDIRLYFLAGPGEEAPVRAIAGGLRRPAPVLPGAALGKVGATMRKMSLCLLNITGTTHLSAAVGTPTFGFYSGYTDSVWRPRGATHGGIVSGQWESCRDIPVGQALGAVLAHARTLGLKA